MTDALVQHRDAIVGTWQTPAPNAVTHLILDDVANLARWEPWVRAATLDFELVSHLHFKKHTDVVADTFTLQHVEATAGQPPTFSRIASMVRPSEAEFVKQLELVEGYAALREDRASEILAQLGTGVAFWSSIANLHPDRTRWTLELIDVALRLANFVEMRFKQALSCRRPIEYSPQIQPMILTPGHGALPSGHATESFMVAYILWTLFKSKGRAPSWCEQLMRQANRIAINRTVAGVHFPADSAAGEMLGLTLGQYFVHRALGTGKFESSRFNGNLYKGSEDFQWRALYDTTAGARVYPVAPATVFVEKVADETAPKSVLLEEIWRLAAAEWL
jgi:hypothetical protein